MHFEKKENLILTTVNRKGVVFEPPNIGLRDELSWVNLF